MSLLKMSDCFEVVDGRSHALSQLEGHPDLDLATKLLICYQYRVIPWLAPAFRALAALPLHQLTESDMCRIPPKFLHSLVTVKHKITTHRLTLAAVPPPAVNGFNCLTPATCSHGWQTAWKNGPSEMFRHPDVHYSGRTVLVALEGAHISGVCSGCIEQSVANVKASGSLLVEEDFVEDMVTELTAWLAQQ